MPVQLDCCRIAISAYFLRDPALNAITPPGMCSNPGLHILLAIAAGNPVMLMHISRRKEAGSEGGDRAEVISAAGGGSGTRRCFEGCRLGGGEGSTADVAAFGGRVGDATAGGGAIGGGEEVDIFTPGKAAARGEEARDQTSRRALR